MSDVSLKLRPKQHFEVLDGLRGVAAMMVVVFHTFEPWNGDSALRQIINHGYLAVDFFFLLSGFVVAYAYDSRWDRMTLGGFFQRRLIRLQPMVVMGSAIGAALFYLQAGPVFPLIAGTAVWKVLVVMLVGFTLVPLLPGMDIRGWQEMHPLNGPAWSLFFEYVANIGYALGVRKLSNRWLGVLVALAGAFLVQMLVFGPRGDAIGGWSVNAKELHIGFARLLFPFLAGMLLMRLGKRIEVRNAFLWCSLLLLVSFSLPRFGGAAHHWENGLYESFCIVVLFPLVVAMGAGSGAPGEVPGGQTMRFCRFAGEISYPLYITHYPLIYIYTKWVVAKRLTPVQGAVWGALLFVTAMTVAYACLKLYDEPVRRWLNRRFAVTGTSTP